jgi:DNA-binding NarL/FixJ family response regulator
MGSSGTGVPARCAAGRDASNGGRFTVDRSAARSARLKPEGRRGRGRIAEVTIALAVRARLDRESLAALLRSGSGVRLIGEAASAEATTRLCALKRPAVAIVDTTFLWPLGPCRIAELQEASPRTRILALPPHDTPWCAVLNPTSRIDHWDLDAGSEPPGCLRLAVREGAHGVLRRSCSAGELIRAIRALARGRLWVGSGISLRDPREPRLSDRERAVARLVGEGRSNKEIAGTLLISELTVKKHVSHILGKLGMHDRLQLGLSVTRHPSRFSTTPDPPERPEA